MRYLLNRSNGRVLPFTPALATKADMLPCDENGNVLDTEALGNAEQVMEDVVRQRDAEYEKRIASDKKLSELRAGYDEIAAETQKLKKRVDNLIIERDDLTKRLAAKLSVDELNREGEKDDVEMTPDEIAAQIESFDDKNALVDWVERSLNPDAKPGGVNLNRRKSLKNLKKDARAAFELG